jgi:uncharacterized protein YpmB
MNPKRDKDVYVLLTEAEIKDRRRALRSQLDARKVHILKTTDSKLPKLDDGSAPTVYQVVEPRTDDPHRMRTMKIWVPTEQYSKKAGEVVSGDSEAQKIVEALDEGEEHHFRDGLETAEKMRSTIKRRNLARKKRLS